MKHPSLPPSILTKAQQLALALERAMQAADCHHTKCQINRLHRKVKYVVGDCQRASDDS